MKADRTRELRRAPVMQSNDVRAAQREQRSAKHQQSTGMLLAIASFVGLGGFGRMLDDMFGYDSTKRGRRSLKASTRDAEQILAPVRAFYRRRPRPWRWYGNNRPRHGRRPGGRTWR